MHISYLSKVKGKGKAGLEWPRMFQEVIYTSIILD
jgi:hypothetical protein